MSKIRILNAEFAELAILNIASSASRTEGLNGEKTLEFTFMAKNTVSSLINESNVVALDSDLFDIAGYTKGQSSDGVRMVSVSCEHISYRLNDSTVDTFAQTGLPTAILTEMLDGTGFSVGTVEFSESITYSVQQSSSRRTLVMELAATLGGEVLFDGFGVSILAQRGSSAPRALRVGRDISDVSKSVDKRTRDDNGNPVYSYECTVYKPDSLHLGDVVTIDYESLGIDVTLRIISMTKDPYNPNNLSVTIGNYVNTLEDDLYRIETSSVAAGKLYYGARISADNGFESIRSDKRARTIMNADIFAMQSGDGSGSSWTNRIYFDPAQGAYVFDGKLSATTIEALKAEIDVVISNTVIVNNLTAAKANIAELTVDQLDTSVMVSNYKAADQSDIEYQVIYEGVHAWITATITDPVGTVQVTNRNGTALYWTDATKTGVTEDSTSWPVMRYTYDLLTKRIDQFETIDGVQVPTITMGAGTGTGENGKARVAKDTAGLSLRYMSVAGDARGIRLDDDGIRQTGNTGADGLRNIRIASTSDPLAQTGDLFIPTGDFSDFGVMITSQSVTLSVTADEQVILCSGTMTVNLFTAIGNVGVYRVIKNTGTGTITVDPYGTETIDGSTTSTLSTQNAVLRIMSNGSNWVVI